MQETFTEKDIEQLDEFGKLINEKAAWSLTTTESIKLYKGLVFFNSLRKKIADNILEYRSLQQAVEPIVGKRKKKDNPAGEGQE